MAVQRKAIEQASEVSLRTIRPRPELAGPGAVATRSPALELQSRLADELSEAPADLTQDERWHPAATVGFVLATCGGFWTLVAIGLSRLAH